MPAYNAAVREYFGRRARVAGGALAGQAGALEQGIWICISADVRDGILCNTGFRAFACPHIMASCNWIVESLEGRPVEALRDASIAEIQAKFDIPVEKAGKLLILQDALRAAYANYAADAG